MITKTLFTNLLLILSFSANAQGFQWAEQVGTPCDDNANAITTDILGNVLITGTFHGAGDFDPGPGVTTLTSAGGRAVLVEKLNAAGNLIWAKSLGGISNAYAHSITTDNLGDIYVFGAFQDSIDLDPDANVYNLYTDYPGEWNYFIVKLTTAGDFQWAIREKSTFLYDFYTSYPTGPASLQLDNNGNIYTTYTFTKESCIYINKYNNSGVKIWGKQLLANGTDKIQRPSIGLYGSSGILISGSFGGTIDFDPGSGTQNITANGHTDGFILRLDTSGNYVWVKTIQTDSVINIFSLTIDPSGNIFTCGLFTKTADFDPSPGIQNRTSTANYFPDMFLLKMDAFGNYMWVNQYGTYCQTNALKSDASGNVYITGYFNNTINFNPGNNPAIPLSSANTDEFIVKVNSSGACKWAEQTLYKNGFPVHSVLSYDIALSATGDIYTVGLFTGTAKFDSAGFTMTSNVFANYDIYIHKLGKCGLPIDDAVLTNGATLTANLTGATYQWIDCNTGLPIPAENNISYTPTVSGRYAVIVTEDGCSDTSYCNQVTVGIDDINTTMRYRVYPNPTNGDINIELDKSYHSVSLEITNVLGQQVYKANYADKNKMSIKIDGADGLYFIHLGVDGVSYANRRIIKSQ